MAPTFATVAEGSTDHAVLENILIGYFKENGIDSGHIIPVQPLLDETGKQHPDSPGGWLQLFYWIRERRYHQVFEQSDYLIIQIDTDACEEVGYDISKSKGGKSLSTEALVEAVREKLESLIGEDALSEYPNQFHFAISVHSLECWLVPLWGKATEKSATLTCKQRVDNGLCRSNSEGLRKDNVRTYRNASADFKKKANLIRAAKAQISLKIFCESLQTILISATSDSSLSKEE